MKIICIGSSAKDIFYPTNEGQIVDTPDDLESQKKFCFELGAKYQINDRFESVGGCAANTACGLANLGIKTACYTKIGDDYIGKWVEEELKKNKVDTSLVETEKNCKSDLSAIIVDINSGEHTIFFNRDANEKLEIFPEKLSNAEWFFISALNGKWEENANKIIEIAKKNNTKIAMNPGQANMKENYKKVLEIIKNSKIVIVNKDEAIGIVDKLGEFPESELMSESFLMKKINEFGPKIVALTDGIRGAWGFNEESILHVNALVKKAVDTTGSGDAFTSGFLAAHLKGKNLEEALKWGIINSSSSVTEYGGQKGLLSQEEIEKLLSQVNVEKLL